MNKKVIYSYLLLFAIFRSIYINRIIVYYALQILHLGTRFHDELDESIEIRSHTHFFFNMSNLILREKY